MRLITSPRDDFEVHVSPKRKNCIVNGILTPFDNNQESISSTKACTISQFGFFLKKYSDSQCCWKKYSGGGKKI